MSNAPSLSIISIPDSDDSFHTIKDDDILSADETARVVSTNQQHMCAVFAGLHWTDNGHLNHDKLHEAQKAYCKAMRSIEPADSKTPTVIFEKNNNMTHNGLKLTLKRQQSSIFSVCNSSESSKKSNKGADNEVPKKQHIKDERDTLDQNQNEKMPLLQKVNPITLRRKSTYEPYVVCKTELSGSKISKRRNSMHPNSFANNFSCASSSPAIKNVSAPSAVVTQHTTKRKFDDHNNTSEVDSKRNKLNSSLSLSRSLQKTCSYNSTAEAKNSTAEAKNSTKQTSSSKDPSFSKDMSRASTSENVQHAAVSNDVPHPSIFKDAPRPSTSKDAPRSSTSKDAPRPSTSKDAPRPSTLKPKSSCHHSPRNSSNHSLKRSTSVSKDSPKKESKPISADSTNRLVRRNTTLLSRNFGLNSTGHHHDHSVDFQEKKSNIKLTSTKNASSSRDYSQRSPGDCSISSSQSSSNHIQKKENKSNIVSDCENAFAQCNSTSSSSSKHSYLKDKILKASRNLAPKDFKNISDSLKTLGVAINGEKISGSLTDFNIFGNDSFTKSKKDVKLESQLKSNNYMGDQKPSTSHKDRKDDRDRKVDKRRQDDQHRKHDQPSRDEKHASDERRRREEKRLKLEKNLKNEKHRNFEKTQKDKKTEKNNNEVRKDEKAEKENKARKEEKARKHSNDLKTKLSEIISKNVSTENSKSQKLGEMNEKMKSKLVIAIERNTERSQSKVSEKKQSTPVASTSKSANQTQQVGLPQSSKVIELDDYSYSEKMNPRVLIKPLKVNLLEGTGLNRSETISINGTNCKLSFIDGRCKITFPNVKNRKKDSSTTISRETGTKPDTFMGMDTQSQVATEIKPIDTEPKVATENEVGNTVEVSHEQTNMDLINFNVGTARDQSNLCGQTNTQVSMKRSVGVEAIPETWDCFSQTDLTQLTGNDSCNASSQTTFPDNQLRTINELRQTINSLHQQIALLKNSEASLTGLLKDLTDDCRKNHVSKASESKQQNETTSLANVGILTSVSTSTLQEVNTETTSMLMLPNFLQPPSTSYAVINPVSEGSIQPSQQHCPNQSTYPTEVSIACQVSTSFSQPQYQLQNGVQVPTATAPTVNLPQSSSTSPVLQNLLINQVVPTTQEPAQVIIRTPEKEWTVPVTSATMNTQVSTATTSEDMSHAATPMNLSQSTTPTVSTVPVPSIPHNFLPRQPQRKKSVSSRKPKRYIQISQTNAQNSSSKLMQQLLTSDLYATNNISTNSLQSPAQQTRLSVQPWVNEISNNVMPQNSFQPSTNNGYLNGALVNETLSNNTPQNMSSTQQMSSPVPLNNNLVQNSKQLQQKMSSSSVNGTLTNDITQNILSSSVQQIRPLNQHTITTNNLSTNSSQSPIRQLLQSNGISSNNMAQNPLQSIHQMTYQGMSNGALANKSSSNNIPHNMSPTQQLPNPTGQQSTQQTSSSNVAQSLQPQHQMSNPLSYQQMINGATLNRSSSNMPSITSPTVQMYNQSDQLRMNTIYNKIAPMLSLNQRSNLSSYQKMINGTTVNATSTNTITQNMSPVRQMPSPPGQQWTNRMLPNNMPNGNSVNNHPSNGVLHHNPYVQPQFLGQPNPMSRVHNRSNTICYQSYQQRAQLLRKNSVEFQRLQNIQQRTEQIQPDQVGQEQLRQEQLRQEQVRQEQVRQEQVRQEQVRQEQVRQEQVRQEQVRQEQVRQEQVRQEQVRQEQMRQEQMRHEQVRQEQMRQEQIRQEQQEQERQDQLLLNQLSEGYEQLRKDSERKAAAVHNQLYKKKNNMKLRHVTGPEHHFYCVICNEPASLICQTCFSSSVCNSVCMDLHRAQHQSGRYAFCECKDSLQVCSKTQLDIKISSS